MHVLSDSAPLAASQTRGGVLAEHLTGLLEAEWPSTKAASATTKQTRQMFRRNKFTVVEQDVLAEHQTGRSTCQMFRANKLTLVEQDVVAEHQTGRSKTTQRHVLQQPSVR